MLAFHHHHAVAFFFFFFPLSLPCFALLLCGVCLCSAESGKRANLTSIDLFVRKDNFSFSSPKKESESGLPTKSTTNNNKANNNTFFFAGWVVLCVNECKQTKLAATKQPRAAKSWDKEKKEEEKGSGMTSKYEKQRLLGHGTFGRVWLVKARQDNQLYCLKEMDVAAPGADADARTEAQVHAGLRHPHIIRCGVSNANANAFFFTHTTSLLPLTPTF